MPFRLSERIKGGHQKKRIHGKKSLEGYPSRQNHIIKRRINVPVHEPLLMNITDTRLD
nr:MAG TPA: Putative Competence protein ComGF [Caudoviricetes sp.]